MNKYVAYHRTSTKDQHLDRGIAELTKYCADNAISSWVETFMCYPAQLSGSQHH